MSQSCQSPSTLREILREAETFAASVRDHDDPRFGRQLEVLRETLDSSPVISADVEHEIVSLLELARRLSRASGC